MLTRLSAHAAGGTAAPEAVGYPTEPGRAGAAPPAVRAMTVDDVVVRTIGLLSLVVLSGAATWALMPVDSGLWFVAMVVNLVFGLVIAFKRITNAYVLGTFAVIEGVFVGGVSKFFEASANGIVLQAVLATAMVFLLMSVLYKSRVIRATPKFQRFMYGALAAAAAVILINFVITMLTGSPTFLRDGGPIAILVSLVFIVIAALSFILSFNEVEQGVRHGLPERYAWLAAFGILVSLVWLYLEILRLLSYFASE